MAWRHASGSIARALAAHRPDDPRPVVLLHDLRLDDVELARQRTRNGLHADPLRGLAVRARPRRAVAHGGTRAHHGVRTSPKYLSAPREGRRRTGRDFDLGALRTVLSTGSPLAPEQFDYVYRAIKGDLHLGLDLGRHRHHLVLLPRQPVAARPSRRNPVTRARHENRGLRRRGPAGARPAGRTGLQRALPVHADRLLGRPGRRQVPFRVFRALRERLCHGDYALVTEHGES